LANRTNLIAEFGRDLLAQGYTSIPNLLLRSYQSMGINDQELVLLLHIIYLQSAENNRYPTVEHFESLMSAPPSTIEDCLNQLLEKKVLAIDQYLDPVTLEYQPVYNLEGLFDKLAEVWAIEKNKEYIEQQQLLQTRRERNQRAVNVRGIKQLPVSAANTISETVARVYKVFESEFGRPLTPMEGESIISWCDQLPAELVIEALRISVIQGTFNLRYIERILQDWRQKNVRTLNEVRKLEESFAEKRVYAGRTRNRSIRNESKNQSPAREDKYRDLYVT
jgi:DNA replication protein